MNSRLTRRSFRHHDIATRSDFVRFALAIGLCLVLGVLGAAGTEAQAFEVDPEAWWTASAPGVSLHTNSDPQRGLEVALALARFRAVFAQLSPDLELRSPTPTTILAFRDAVVELQLDLESASRRRARQSLHGAPRKGAEFELCRLGRRFGESGWPAEGCRPDRDSDETVPNSSI